MNLLGSNQQLIKGVGMNQLAEYLMSKDLMKLALISNPPPCTHTEQGHNN